MVCGRLPGSVRAAGRARHLVGTRHGPVWQDAGDGDPGAGRDPPAAAGAGVGIGQPFLEWLGVDLDGLDYDFFPLFGPDAVWNQTPPRPVSSGATVIGDSQRLARDLARLVG